MACDSRQSSLTGEPNTNQNTLVLPAKLVRALQIGDGAVNAYITVDTHAREPVQILASGVEFTITQLKPGKHTVLLEFEYSLSGESPLNLARAQQDIDLIPGENYLDFKPRQFNMAFNRDDDSLSNIDELLQHYDPLIAEPEFLGESAIVRKENTTGTIAVIEAQPPKSGSQLSYRLSGGDDGNAFRLDASTGELTFLTVPDYEAPHDNDRNNRFTFSVTADDGVVSHQRDYEIEILNALDLTVTGSHTDLTFRWDGVDNAPTPTYRLLEKNAAGEWPTIHEGGEFAFLYAIAGARFQWTKRLYKLEAYSADGSTLLDSTAPVPVNAAMLDSIDRLYADDTQVINYRAISISEDGSTLAVGDTTQNSDEGAVYLFARVDSGAWLQQSKLTPSTGTPDYFGTSLSLSADGGILAVSAPNAGSKKNGAVYLFKRTPANEWTIQSSITPPSIDNSGFQNFGLGMDMSADAKTLAVGEPGKPIIHVYKRANANATWAKTASLSPDPNITPTGTTPRLGKAVRVSGDGTTVAGLFAAQASVTFDTHPGVYVFKTKAGKVYQQVFPQLDAGDKFASDFDLDYSGKTLAIGAPGEASLATGINDTVYGELNNDSTNSGAAYIYVWNNTNTNWDKQTYIKAPVNGSQDRFGSRLDLSDNGFTLVISAPGEDGSATGVNTIGATDDLGTDSGAVILMTRNLVGEWRYNTYIKAPKTVTQFGKSIRLSGDGNVMAAGSLQFEKDVEPIYLY